MIGVLPALRRMFASPVILYPRDRRQNRLFLLDGARGLAALAVLFWHYQHFYFPIGGRKAQVGYRAHEPLKEPLWLFYNHGLMAVPIFWMISGLVFATVYYSRPATTREFAANRFARLYPLHLLTLLTVAALQWGAQAKFGATLIYRFTDTYHFGLQLFLASNWGFETAMTFNGPIWSVSVEVLVYALFWTSRSWLPRWGILLPILFFAPLIVLSRMFLANAVASCALYFFLGTVLATIIAAWDGQRTVLAAAAGCVFVLGVMIMLVAPLSVSGVLGIPVTFSGAIVLIVLAEPRAPAWLRVPAGLVGDSTYGIYLWQVPVQMAMILALSPAIDVARAADSPWFLLAFVAIVLLIARVSYVGFERPMRFVLRRFGVARGDPVGPAIAAP